MRILAWVVAIIGVAGLALAAGLFAVFTHFDHDLPGYRQLASYRSPGLTRIYTADGRLLAEQGAERRIFVPIAAIPKRIVDAFLAAEDREFYSHQGVDPLAVLRATVLNAVHWGSHRRPMGASTITQQVTKNLLLTNELSYERKVKEAILAWRIEHYLSKARILELYLNQIYMGAGTYGVAMAAQAYFDKPLDQVTLAEAAFLAALPKAPNTYNPLKNPELAVARRDWVLRGMVAAGSISEGEARDALAQSIVLHPRPPAGVAGGEYFADEVRRVLLAKFGEQRVLTEGLTVRTTLDPELQAAAQKALRDGLVTYDRRHGWRGPIGTLPTGPFFFPNLSAMEPPPGAEGWTLAAVVDTDAGGATLALREGGRGYLPLDELRWARRAGSGNGPLNTLGPPVRAVRDVVRPGDIILVEPLASGPPLGNGRRLFGLRQVPLVNGALVALDQQTGRVLALAGGLSYQLSQFDRATQAKRQPGSSIKPFVYLAGLERGLTPATLLKDLPVSIDQGPGLPRWTPNNFTGKPGGILPLRIGIEQSRNLMTVNLAQTIGLQPIATEVEAFGVMDKMPPYYSMVLGAGETTLLRLTAAYAGLATGGRQVMPTVIDRVQTADGRNFYTADTRSCPGCRVGLFNNQPMPVPVDGRRQLADARSVYQLTSMLQGVIERGTARAAGVEGQVIAAKTGTTDDFVDAWIVGYTASITVGVFVGFDTPASLGTNETGGVVAAPIFHDFMTVAMRGKPGRPFPVPEGLHFVAVNRLTGELSASGSPNSLLDVFRRGTEPTRMEKPPEPPPSEMLGPDAPPPDVSSGATSGSAPSAPFVDNLPPPVPAILQDISVTSPKG
ncbi:MAG TPA: PBP1A family penicillin-binding protein [Stellaceae bacterium]|nr:PBP1A family penicillin-binding protein [Stellaceae bacterium]